MKIRTHAAVAAFFGLTLLSSAALAEVRVDGSDRSYPETRQATVSGKATSLKLTGVGLREKAFINVYVIGSYVDQAASPKGPGDLATTDVPKQMILTMERDVDGKKMADALSEAIRANYPSGLDAELGQLEAYLRSHPLSTGDEVDFTWLPGGGGVVCAVLGQSPLTIKSAAFAKAVWDIWLGDHPVQKDIKKGLVSRL
jgi:hypothetical protein